MGCLALCALLVVAGCKTSTATVAPESKTATQAQVPAYPPRPGSVAPAFKIFHQDDDTYTLVTKADASDEEIEAILWQFRDAVRTHGFDALHLSQKFVDTRKPSIWFHVYRGPKCANEKFVKGKYPCGAKYNGAGDFTLGAYNNPGWNEGILHHPDGSESQLWNSEAPDSASTTH